MDFVFDDGGRKDVGYKGTTGDCACRAISIVTGKPYKEVYELINVFGAKERKSKNRTSKSTARTGVYSSTMRKIMKSLGYTWTPTMLIGQGCKVHLKSKELPAGKILVNVSKHYTAVIKGVIHDTHDCSRQETRCVYGYYQKS